jgi:MFS family permease
MRVGLEFGGKTYTWDSWQIIGLFVIGVVGTLAFIAVERKAEEPVLPLNIFKSRMVTGTSIICFCQGVIMFSAISYLPLYSVIVLKHMNSNGILTPMMVSLVVGAISFGILQTKFAFRTVMVLSMALGVLSAFLLMNLSHDLRSLYMTGIMILLGFGAIGPMMSVGQNAIAASVEPRYIGVSSSIVGFWRSIGGVMGASIMAVIVNNSLKDQITQGATKYNLNAEQMAGLTKSENLIHLKNLTPELGEFVRNALGTAINKGFIVAAIVLIIGFIVALTVGPARLGKKTEGQKAGVSHMA